MRFLAMTLLLLSRQDSARELVERLRSESVEARDEAERRLKALGRPAAPELEKAAKDADDEVASRARRLLRILALRETLPPAILREFPGAEERLAGGPQEWTALFLRAAEWREGDRGPSHPSLSRADLDPLAAEAFRGAAGDEERERVAGLVRNRSLRSGIPGLVELLRHPLLRLREGAIEGLQEMEAFEATPAIAELLRDPDVLSSAGNAIIHLRAWRAMPRVIGLLDHEDGTVRRRAVDVVRRMGAREALPRVRVLLKDPDPGVRFSAVDAAGTMEDRESGGTLLALVKDPDPRVRRFALQVVSEWKLPGAPPAILASLEDPEEEVVQAAIRQSRDFGLRAAVPALLRRLREERFCGLAGEALSRIADPESIPELRELLRHPAAFARREAAEALAGLQCRPAIPEIARLLNDTDPFVRAAAAEALGALGAREQAGAIAEHLADPHPAARGRSIRALRTLGAADLAPRFLAMLGDPEEWVVLEALEAVRTLKPAGSAGPVARLLGKSSESVGDKARVALRAIGEKEALPELRRLFKDEDAKVRGEAAEAACAFPGGASRELLALLADSDVEVQRSAAWSLGVLRVKEAVPRLVERLDRKETRSIFLWALGEIGDRSAVGAVLRWLKDGEPPARVQAFRTLGRLADREAVPALVRVLRDESSEVQGWALAILSDLGATKAIPEIIKLLEAEGDVVRAQIPEVLSDLGAAEAAPGIAKLLRADSSGTRSAGLKALGALRAKAFLPEIRKALGDESPSVAYMAADVVGKLGDADSIPALRGLLGHPDEWVRDSAARALAALGVREGIPTLFQGRGVSSLFELNRLRAPETWTRLEKVAVREDIRGPVREMWAKLGAVAGLPVEIAPPPTSNEAQYLEADGRWRCRNGLATVLDAMDRESSFYEVVLERDRIRILWKDDGLRFWRAWWEEERKK